MLACQNFFDLVSIFGTSRDHHCGYNLGDLILLARSKGHLKDLPIGPKRDIR
jgi:hypothetical protein